MHLERIPGVRQIPTRLRRQHDDAVLFDGWRGRYADSPRAISEALHVLRPGLRHLWVTDDAARETLPAWAAPVRPGTGAYLSAFGAARFIVANTHLPDYFRKRRGAFYLQTWHGTPLKRIGFDMPNPQLPDSAQYLQQLRRDVARWDALVSPNPFSTAIFRDAFRFDGAILETGYPRNDVLVSPASGAIRDSVRRELGLPADARAILYAPTWRDTASFELELDLALVGERLGVGSTILLRVHPKLTSDLRGKSSRVIDVSTHPDIGELYLAADVLMTDYSSAMFDFAVTRKPILFFTYDLETYRDELRGFYFDFEREAPGPLVSTTAELCDALEDLDSIVASYAPAYGQFVARFCPLDDGSASQRVIEAVFP